MTTIRQCYSQESDITFLLVEQEVLGTDGEILGQVCNFYYGEPSEEITNRYIEENKYLKCLKEKNLLEIVRG